MQNSDKKNKKDAKSAQEIFEVNAQNFEYSFISETEEDKFLQVYENEEERSSLLLALRLTLQDLFPFLSHELIDQQLAALTGRMDIDDMSYEQLLQLQEDIGVVSRGLPKAQIDSINGQIFMKSAHNEKCAICLDGVANKQSFVKLKCQHIFHTPCIKSWLKEQKVCPTCKVDINYEDLK